MCIRDQDQGLVPGAEARGEQGVLARLTAQARGVPAHGRGPQGVRPVPGAVEDRVGDEAVEVFRAAFGQCGRLGVVRGGPVPDVADDRAGRRPGRDRCGRWLRGRRRGEGLRPGGTGRGLPGGAAGRHGRRERRRFRGGERRARGTARCRGARVGQRHHRDRVVRTVGIRAGHRVRRRVEAVVEAVGRAARPGVRRGLVVQPAPPVVLVGGGLLPLLAHAHSVDRPGRPKPVIRKVARKGAVRGGPPGVPTPHGKVARRAGTCEQPTARGAVVAAVPPPCRRGGCYGA